jgi:hypothetical protein
MHARQLEHVTSANGAGTHNMQKPTGASGGCPPAIARHGYQVDVDREKPRRSLSIFLKSTWHHLAASQPGEIYAVAA